MINIKKELLIDNKCRVIDAMSQVSNKLMSTLPCCSTYAELCAFYLNLDNTLENINKELSIIEKHLDEVSTIEEEDSVNV